MTISSKIPSISLFGASCAFIFFIFSLLGRVIYPFGDEPDFDWRVMNLIFGNHDWWSPYYWLSGLFSQLDYTSNCIINSTPLSLTQEIDRATCTQNIWQILLRLIITVTVSMPLLLAVTLRKSFVSLTKLLRYKISYVEWNERLNILSLTLIFPGFIYFFGVLAEEQYVLMLSIMVFLLWGNIYIIIFLLFLISTVDIGNVLVVSYFVMILFFLEKAINKLKITYVIFLFFILTLLFAILNFYVFELLSNITFMSNKATSIIDAYKDSDVIKKYPIYFRPIITLMSFILFTPNYVKSVPAYIIFYSMAVYAVLIYKRQFQLSYKVRKNYLVKYADLKIKAIYFLTAIATIITLISILPNYSNGKYYIFLIPFLMLPAYTVFNKKSILKFMFFTNTIIFINILFYYG